MLLLWLRSFSCGLSGGHGLISLLCCGGSSDELPVPVCLSTVASCGHLHDMDFLMSSMF